MPYERLSQMFEEAHKIVPPGTRWLHYKGAEYTAWRLAIIEATEEIVVVYSDLLYPEISFVCPLSKWNGQVESSNGVVNRFRRIA